MLEFGHEEGEGDLGFDLRKRSCHVQIWGDRRGTQEGGLGLRLVLCIVPRCLGLAFREGSSWALQRHGHADGVG